MKLIIAGGRDLNEDEAYELILHYMHDNPEFFRSITEIVTGGARGADAAGADYATVMNFPHTEIKANWDLYGKFAGPMRNRQMGQYADAVLALWDGKSPGTKNMLDFMHRAKKPTYIIKV